MTFVEWLHIQNLVECFQQSIHAYMFLQVPDTGNYTFYVSCDDWCELWKYDVDEYGIENRSAKAEEILTNQPIIAVYAWTGRLQWNK